MAKVQLISGGRLFPLVSSKRRQVMASWTRRLFRTARVTDAPAGDPDSKAGPAKMFRLLKLWTEKRMSVVVNGQDRREP
jgi:hypothetical protein